jgi:di/tricarboxylate transporter
LTLHQIESLAIIAGMLVLFLSDRLRYDLVAALALCCAALTGVVPAGKVFSGFANPVIIIIASVLVLSRAIAVSGVIDVAMRRLLRRLNSTTLQVGSLTAAVTFLSALIKNVGTLGVFLPLAIQAAERRRRPVSLYLMPLSFGSLIGGTITLIGTSPNLLISTVRQDITGHPYRLFDFAPVGLPLSIVAVAFLSVGWRLLPKDRRGSASAEKKFQIEDYTSEALLPEGSPLVGKTVADLEAPGEGEVTVAAIIREQEHRYIPAADWVLFAGDLLVLQGDPVQLKPVVDQARLELLGAAEAAERGPQDRHDELEAVEAVVSADSPLVGNTPEELRLRQRHELNVLALSRGGARLTTRLRQNRFRPGDVVVLQGRRNRLADTLARLGCLPLAERNLSIGRPRPRLTALIVLAVALGLITAHLVPPELGFFMAGVFVVLLGVISPKEAYDSVEWPIVVMLACLIPVGEGLKETGAAGLIGDGLTLAAAHLSGTLAVGLVLVVSMLLTPLLHHAAAVLVMGPVAAAVAKNLGLAVDPFLMAVALGAACDFLTPIGHQNNTLVMGPAGYRFGDYWRLGLPLSVLTAVLGTLLIVWVWPLR